MVHTYGTYILHTYMHAYTFWRTSAGDVADEVNAGVWHILTMHTCAHTTHTHTYTHACTHMYAHTGDVADEVNADLVSVLCCRAA